MKNKNKSSLVTIFSLSKHRSCLSYSMYSWEIKIQGNLKIFIIYEISYEGNCFQLLGISYFFIVATLPAFTQKLVFQPQVSILYILVSFIESKSNLDPISFSSLRSFTPFGSYSLPLGFNPMIDILSPRLVFIDIHTPLHQPFHIKVPSSIPHPGKH